MGARDGERLTLPRRADVVVAGGGPAGRSAARACARRGLAVVLVEPRPDRTWHHTYGLWHHELPTTGPDALGREVVAARGVGWALAGRAHRLDDEYAVLDTGALQHALHDDAVTCAPGRVVAVAPSDDRARTLAVLDDGREIRAGLVADASGAAQALSAHRPDTRARPAAEQTAVGVVVDAATAARVTGGRLLFMDWRPRHGVPGWPTFLYAVPLGGDRWLLEETSLARRPGLPLPELRERLRRRLLASGLSDDDIPLDDRRRVEHVRFPVDTPAHRSPAGVVALGAAAPLVHPATGFSVARSLAAATRLADAAAVHLTRPEYRVTVDGSGGADSSWARRAVLGPQGRLVHAMRHRGLDVLLRMPPGEVPAFFDTFFALPPARRRAYLEAGEDVGAALGSMLGLFARLPPRLRGHLVAGSVLGPGRDPGSSSGA